MTNKKPSPKASTVALILKGALVVMVAVMSLYGLQTITGCNDTNTGNNPDLSASTEDMTFFSCCGQPGDPGNSMGVGKFCRTDNDCLAGAPLCAIVYQAAKRSYFCTTTCDAPDAGTRGCGPNATCTRDSTTGFYGCVPSSCLVNMPPGCMN
jgi:hypothetical protein